MHHIVLKNVKKSLGGHLILKDVNMEVIKGEVLAVVGPSGSGKTTLIRCINRLVECDGGSIMIGEELITDMVPTDLRRRVSLVRQDAVMLPGTVGKNVSFGLTLKGEENDGLVKRTLSMAGLPEDYIERDAETLSGGEKQRVALARSLVLSPEVLLLDEPTASVDPKLKHDMEFFISSTARNAGITTIWVTHDVEQAKRVGDRIANLKDGMIRNISVPEDFDWEGAY